MSSCVKVSIIVLNHNRSDLTNECVKAVIENTESGSYELIVVDNGSGAEQIERLVVPPIVTVLRLSRNLFFGEANNIAAERANGEYLVLLNNDAKVTSGWLTAMLRVFDENFDVGAVGPKFLFPDGSLQEAGAFILPDGGTMQLRFAGTPLLARYVNRVQVVDYCSAACLLMRKSDFLSLGGFDPIFEPAYYEDVDLAVRLRSIGLFSYYCGHAEVFHQQHATSHQIWTAEQLDKFATANYHRFNKRWGDYLRRRMQGPCEPAALAPVTWSAEPAPVGKPRLVLYSSNTVNVSEASRRLLVVASAFQQSHDVVIAADEVISRCRIYSLCREFGIGLTSFRTGNISDLPELGSDLVVTFDIDGRTCGHFQNQIAFERDGDRLLELLD